MWSVGEVALKSVDLRPRHLLALTMLRDFSESSQADLARTLKLDKTNLVGLLNELEERDWIVRRRSPEDRRRHVVELTDGGRETLARAEMLLGAVESEILAGLDHAEREQLHQLLLKAAQSVSRSAELSGAGLLRARSDPAQEC
jgi:MarR family transcriptional regulator, lower aerobic nicotinate degradation pathway regulator